MRKEARILFIYEQDNPSCKTFVDTLKKSMAGWDITIGGAKLSTVLFDARKYNLVHLFHSPTSRAAGLLRKIGGQVRKVQTVLGPPEKPDDYSDVLDANTVVVFSEAEKNAVLKQKPGLLVEAIPPCADLPDVNLLQPSSQVRDKYQVGDRLMVLALSDISSKSDFDAILYPMREYNRNGGFRFLVPQFRKDKETLLWRARVQERITQENLASTTLLGDDLDVHSLIDAADMSIHFGRDHESRFDFPLEVLESVSLGKPTLCFDRSPFNETLKSFKKEWICNNIEDFAKQSLQINRDAARLEQTSTELARFARSHFSGEAIASAHKRLYESNLK